MSLLQRLLHRLRLRFGLRRGTACSPLRAVWPMAVHRPRPGLRFRAVKRGEFLYVEPRAALPGRR